MCQSDSDVSYEYVQDPNYEGEASASQACFSKGGNSYTPPGWMRSYKRKRTATGKAVKKIKYDD